MRYPLDACPRCGARRDADIHLPGYSCDYYLCAESVPEPERPVVVDFWGNVEDVFATALARPAEWPTTLWAFDPFDRLGRELTAELNGAAFSPALAIAILAVFGPPRNTGVVYDPYGCATRAIIAAKRGHAYLAMTRGQRDVDQILTLARRLHVLQHVGLERGDARLPPFADASADFCYTEAPHVPPDRLRRVIGQVGRILKPGGTACWVVRPHRERDELVPLHADLTALHRAQGYRLREEVILTQTAPRRIDSGLLRVHEHLLVYTRP